jgi:hypothetical protein
VTSTFSTVPVTFETVKYDGFFPPGEPFGNPWLPSVDLLLGVPLPSADTCTTNGDPEVNSQLHILPFTTKKQYPQSQKGRLSPIVHFHNLSEAKHAI